MTNFHVVLLAVVLSLTVGPVDAFWRMVCGTVQVGRVDPIVNPNGISGHCHTIAGPNNINTTSTFDSLQASYCTSCSIQKDKSAYWTPNLYYRHRNGSYEEVPHDGHVVYYLDRGVDVANMVPFPKGFRMVSGDAAARSYDSVTMTYGNKTFGGQPVSNRVSFACLDSSGPQPETPGFKSTKCDAGLRAQIHFQTCWDGNNLYKSDNSHVAYLSGMDNGICPPDHPHLLPHLFFEIIYSVRSIDQSDGGMFVFSQGDTTGYGFHGDFMNGWDPDVLVDAIDQCMGPSATNDGQIGLCPPLQASVDPYYSQNCPEQVPLVNETVHGLLNVLPGCNPPTGGPTRATQNICPVQPGLNNVPNQDYATRAVAKPGDKVGNWQYMGCALDSTSTRPLATANYGSATNMTIETCTAYCKAKGYFYAGLEFASQCYCGGAVQQPLQSVLNCSQQNYMTCSGNNFEYCGGQQLMQIWNDTSYTGKVPMGVPQIGQTTLSLANNLGTATYQGCYVEGVGGHALSATSFSNITGMTLEMCAAFCVATGSALFGAEYSQECYCGNSISTAQTAQTDCNLACKGDNTELCGAGSRLSVWSLDKFKANLVTGTSAVTSGSGSTSGSTSSVPLATNVTSLGCYNEVPSGTRALTAFYTSGTTMTVDMCAQLAQQKNLQYFGLEYASQCLAGSILNPVSLPIASSKCNMKCAGNTTETCGGANAINLYNNTQYITPYSPNPVTIPNQAAQYGYVGCYTEGTGAKALGSTSNSGSYSPAQSTSMTVESCAAVCNSKGYSWMGVENGQYCFCNAAGPINAAVRAPETDCNVTCSGNPTENCGAASRINIYQLKSSSGTARLAGTTTANSTSTSRTGNPTKRSMRFKAW